jgi:signal transduction histidine kinase/DNA-binding response OmpR family regulator
MDGQSPIEAAEPERRGKTVPLSMLPFPVLRLNAGGTVMETNGVLERDLGLDETALRGAPFLDLVTPEQRDGLARLLATPEDPQTLQVSFRTDRSAQRRTISLIQRDGEWWIVGQPTVMDAERNELARARHRAEAQNDEYARLSTELRAANDSLDRRAQELEEATQTKARFLATMSHELRTPLNAVLGYAGLLRDGVYGHVTDAQDRAVHSIVRRAKDLQLLIDDVLDLSRMEAGRMEIRVDEFHPADVISEVREEMSSVAREKELSVVVRYDLGESVRTDRAKYKHVLLNLVSNAVKFTPPRGEVEIAVGRGEDDTFVTRVRDTGIGIAREHLHEIFGNFQQIETGTTRRFGGMGLGLSLARRMLDHLGGTIDVDSAPGRGTTFAISLPLRPVTETMAVAMEDVPPDRLNEDPVVLAIDDDPEVIALLRDSLAPARFRVVGALNGDRGIELARILQPFAITLDIMMPEKDGWQVLRELKADPTVSEIPVIIMSIVSERALGFSLGVTEYLVKPVDRRILIDVLERLRQQRTAPTAIVVDDDYDTRILMRDLLDSLGFRVRVTASADEALAIASAETPDVMFVDLTMPEREFARVLEAASTDRRFGRTRLVAVTRSDMDGRNAAWLRRAAAQVVYKGRPQPEELLRELRKALSAISESVGRNE